MGINKYFKLKRLLFFFMIIVLFKSSFCEEKSIQPNVSNNEIKCEEEEFFGTYRDYCDCGASNVVVLKSEGDVEIINYDELWDCHLRLKWKKNGNYIETFGSPYINMQKFKIEKQFPTNQKLSKIITGFEINELSKQVYEQNKSVEHILIYEVNDPENILFEKRETYFFKTYSIEDFKVLKCEKNKDVFLKRMIYSEKFFSEKEVKAVNFINNIAIKEKMDINRKDGDGVTALHAAVDCGFEKTVELLLKNGADPKIKNTQGYTPLSLAKKNGSKEIVELLKKYGAKE